MMNEEAGRETFEKWASPRGLDLTRVGESYLGNETQWVYAGWLARAAICGIALGMAIGRGAERTQEGMPDSSYAAGRCVTPLPIEKEKP